MKNKLTIKCEPKARQVMTSLAKACGWQFVEFVDENTEHDRQESKKGMGQKDD